MTVCASLYQQHLTSAWCPFICCTAHYHELHMCLPAQASTTCCYMFFIMIKAMSPFCVH